MPPPPPPAPVKSQPLQNKQDQKTEAPTNSDYRREIAKRLLTKEPDEVFDDLLEGDLKEEGEEFLRTDPSGEADVADRRAWRRLVHQKMEWDHKKVTCSFCAHETESRD